MSGINRYNQILISVIGTIILIAVLVTGVNLLIDFLKSDTYVENTLIVREELDSLKELNVRNQIVSLDGIYLFDSASNTYLIPVRHKQLSDPSSRDDQVFELLDAQSISGYQYYAYGNYNNLVLYEFSSSNTRVLLDSRMNIDRYDLFSSKSRKLVVFTGWDEDTNSDGKLSEEDFKIAYVYNHGSGEIKQLNNSSYKILSFEYLENIEQLVFRVTNAQTTSTKREELPEFLVFYSFEDNMLIPIVDQNTLNRLQEIIDN